MTRHFRRKSNFFFTRGLGYKLLYVTLFLLMPFNLSAFKIGKFDFYATNEFLYNFNKLAEKENQFYETFSLLSNYKKWSLGFTLRGNNFFKQSPNLTLDNLCLDVHRKFVQYNTKDLKINIGDFYSLLGRGLVLSVLKNEDILRERTILGGNILYNRGKWDLKFLGGVLKDETNDQEWLVAGGEAAVEYIKNNRMGVHFSYIDDIETRRKLGKRQTGSISFQGAKLFKNFSYYTEFAFLKYQEADEENGRAIFANLTYSKLHVTSFIEFKRYEDFDNEINNPPVADQEEEVSTLNDATGVRLYFQYAFFDPDITLHFNIGRYREYDDTGNNIYTGIAIEDLWERVNLSASYGVKDILYRIKKFDGHFLYQLTDRLSAEVFVKDKRYNDGNFIFREEDQSIQGSYSPYFSIFVLHQYSHNKIMNRNHFFSGGVKIYLSGGTVIEISGGTIRGGQICSGGQCFTAPPFRGLKLSIISTFK